MVRVAPIMRKLHVFLLVFFLAMSWLAWLTPRSAHAAGGSISGVVTDEGGAPLGAIRVMAYRWVGDPAVETPHRVLEQTAMTLTDGSYTLAVPAADYYLRFVDTVVPVRYADKFYGDVFDISDASAVIVNDGAAVTGIQTQLALAGTISGQVQDPAGNPAVGVEVWAYRPVDNGTGEVTTELRGKTEVKADGSYALALAYTGNVRLYFSDPAGVYQGEYYNNLFQDEYPFQNQFSFAQDVPVTVGAQTTGINAVLDKLGRFTGSVTDRNGQPLAGITASAHRRYINGSGITEWPSLGETKSGADGRYDFVVYAIDAFGNTSNVSATSSIIIDTTAPDPATDSLEARIGRMVQWTWQREPTSEETAELVDLANRHGLEAVARALFNADDFLFVD